MNYQPKGGMCANCTRATEDCSGLPFHKMPAIIHTHDIQGDTTIVRCTWHERQHLAKTAGSEAE